MHALLHWVPAFSHALESWPGFTITKGPAFTKGVYAAHGQVNGKTKYHNTTKDNSTKLQFIAKTQRWQLVVNENGMLKEYSSASNASRDVPWNDACEMFTLKDNDDEHDQKGNSFEFKIVAITITSGPTKVRGEYVANREAMEKSDADGTRPYIKYINTNTTATLEYNKKTTSE